MYRDVINLPRYNINPLQSRAADGVFFVGLIIFVAIERCALINFRRGKSNEVLVKKFLRVLIKDNIFQSSLSCN